VVSIVTSVLLGLLRLLMGSLCKKAGFAQSPNIWVQSRYVTLVIETLTLTHKKRFLRGRGAAAAAPPRRHGMTHVKAITSHHDENSSDDDEV